MEEETAVEVVRGVLVDVARNAETITYDELLARLDEPVLALVRTELARVLRRISIAEDDAGRGLLSAIVVRADTGRPGKGWFELAAQRGRESTAADAERVWADEVALVHRSARDA